MKRFPLFFLGLGLLCSAGCDRKITIATKGDASSFTPSQVNVRLGRGDRVIFVNKDDRVHRVTVGGVTTTLFPKNPRPERPSTLTWTIPPATKPPATIAWSCEAHPGETGTITVEP